MRHTWRQTCAAGLKADRCEARDWMLRAARQGSWVGMQHLDFLNRLRNAPTGKDTCRPVGG